MAYSLCMSPKGSSDRWNSPEESPIEYTDFMRLPNFDHLAGPAGHIQPSGGFDDLPLPDYGPKNNDIAASRSSKPGLHP